MKRLVILTTPTFFDGEADILYWLFEAGMTLLHLRKPGCSETELEMLIDCIPAIYHQHIVLHDHFGLAEKWELQGIHLNSRNREIPRGYAGSISRSCHSLEELADLSIYNYVFLSPVFSSISKEGYPSGFSPEALDQATARGLINHKVIALGGMDNGTIPRIAHLPFGGIAVLGALWGETNDIRKESVVNRFLLLQHCITKYRTTC